MATTLENVTDEQIEKLSREAAEAGDLIMVEYCEAARDESIRTTTKTLSNGALVNRAGARKVCAEAINDDAEAMAKKRVYRLKDSAAPGPDYVCGRCGASGLRLWRQSHVFLDNVDLRCAPCATAEQTEQIARYAHFHDPESATIGDLLPARPTPEGDTFWGHTSGDVEWWYALPQFTEPKLEAELVRRERDHFLLRYQQSLAYEADLHRRLAEARAPKSTANYGATGTATLAEVKPDAE